MLLSKKWLGESILLCRSFTNDCAGQPVVLQEELRAMQESVERSAIELEASKRRAAELEQQLQAQAGETRASLDRISAELEEALKAKGKLEAELRAAQQHAGDAATRSEEAAELSQATGARIAQLQADLDASRSKQQELEARALTEEAQKAGIAEKVRALERIQAELEAAQSREADLAASAQASASHFITEQAYLDVSTVMKGHYDLCRERLPGHSRPPSRAPTSSRRSSCCRTRQDLLPLCKLCNPHLFSILIRLLLRGITGCSLSCEYRSHADARSGQGMAGRTLRPHAEARTAAEGWCWLANAL